MIRPNGHGVICILLFVLFLAHPSTVWATSSSELEQSSTVRLTATQSLLVEHGPDDWSALGTLALDLAMGPRWNWTYIYDRGVDAELWAQHDLSVTRVLWRDTTATLGVRLKIPDDEDAEWYQYGLVAWRWGG